MSTIFASFATGGGLSLFQGVGQVFNAFSQSQQIENQGEAAAQAQEYNAAVARNNAMAVQQSAAADRKQQDRVNLARFGKLKTQILKQGVELQGTPMLLLGEEAAQGSLESQKITYRGDIQANNYLAQAAQDQFAADVSRSSASTKANSTLLTGFTKSSRSFGGY